MLDSKREQKKVVLVAVGRSSQVRPVMSVIIPTPLSLLKLPNFPSPLTFNLSDFTLFPSTLFSSKGHLEFW